MTKIADRDIWWEARNSHRPNRLMEIGREVIQSLPGRPARSMFVGARSILGAADKALAIDLNKYRSGRNLKAYQDAGVDCFILRIGGPTQWVEGAWNYQIDATYKPYLEQLDKLGMLGSTIGYIVHNPFEETSINGATGETMHTELIDDWTSGGWMSQAFVYDHEVNTCWRGSTKITATAPNLVKSLNINTDNTWKKFKRMVGIYTARWFINATSLTEHTTYLDNINRPDVGKQRPMWYAWYAQTYAEQYTNLRDSLTKLIDPTVAQINSLLQCGSYSLADLWQYTYTLKLTGDDIGVDANVSLGTKAQFFDAFGLKTEVTPPPPPPPPPPSGDYVTRAEFDALVAEVDTRLDWLDKHTHTTGGPV